MTCFIFLDSKTPGKCNHSCLSLARSSQLPLQLQATPLGDSSKETEHGLPSKSYQEELRTG